MVTAIKDPLITQAEANLAARLGIDANAVDIAVGDKKDGGTYVPSRLNISDDQIQTNLVFTITMPGLDLDQKAARTKIRETFGAIPAINELAQMKAEDKMASEVLSQLKAATSDTDFNTKLLDWPAFNPEIAKQGWGVDDYALNCVGNNAYGIEFSMHIPTDKKTDPAPLAEKVTKLEKERVESGEIKTILTERAEKYIKANLQAEGKSQEEIDQTVAKMREDMAKIVISVNVERDRGVTVSIRSPEQAEAHKKAPNDYSEPDNADALCANNPLQHILTNQLGKDEHPQLHKALARAFLFTKDEITNKYTKPVEVFPLVAGRHNMKVAIAKELSRIKAERPDKAEDLAKIIESPIFKEHQAWADDKGDKVAPTPIFEKDPAKVDTMKVWLPIDMSDERFKDKNPVKDAIKSLAAMGAPAQEQAQQPAGIAPESTQMGAALPPAQQEAAWRESFNNAANQLLAQHDPVGAGRG